MGVLDVIKGWWNRMFSTEVKRQFNVNKISSNSMDDAVKSWMDVYTGNPSWAVDGVRTINFAKKICEEVARLATLDIDVAIDGARKDYMQGFFDKSVKGKLRNWLEYGVAGGTMILKPNGIGVDIVTPDRFSITQKDGNGNITGIVFQDGYTDGEEYYTKLEYHRFMEARVKMADTEDYTDTTYYTISNKAFVSKNSSDIGKQVDLKNTKWANIRPETNITKRNEEKLDSMLFGVFKMPSANNIDLDSPLGMSAYANALEELRDLDIAYSRKAEEIEDSRRTVLIDSDKLIETGKKAQNPQASIQRLGLPRFVRNVMGNGATDFYQEINPTLNTEQRQRGINDLLSLIGCKCGFSNGYFVLDAKTGMITATQVESDDRETIQLIKDVRDALKGCIEELLYAQSVFADLYNLSPYGEYEATYSFGDITYNYQEDKAMWWMYVQAGKVPAYRYFMKFEKMSEEDAKAMEAEMLTAQMAQMQGGLFDE